MTEIKVHQKEKRTDSWVFEIRVEEDGSSTVHSVTLNKDDFNRLKWDSPEELVKKSFEFLLERESKESILREFNLMDIPRYFPEYEEKIAGS